MRLCMVALFALFTHTAVSAAGRQSFPYTAYVTDDNVYYRSGPGETYYPTGKLQAGDKVDVYRHDPGGWYAIRPPEGSFSWVSGRYVKLGDDGLAEVTGDRVAARVGSQFSDIRDVIAVRLHLGEVVEVLDSKEISTGEAAGTWYKIAPPSGEFRWVFGKYVSEDYEGDGVRKAAASHSPLLHPSRTPSDTIPVAAEQTAQEPSDQAAGQPASDAQAAEHWAPLAERPESEALAKHYTNKFADRAADPAGSLTRRRISPDEFQTDEIDVELSIMLVEEPTVWTFDELGMRARFLLTQVETAVERGRAQALVRRIEQSEDIKTRYDAVAAARTRTERHDRQLADLSRTRESFGPAQASENRFDGSGRLARVVSSKLGTPRYALLDDKGDLRCYVTPAPGVKMEYYLGRRIGVSGIQGYIAESRTRHVTAKHVTALENRPLR